MPRSSAVAKEAPQGRTQPIRNRRAVEAAEQTVGQDRPRDLPAKGKSRLEARHIEPVEHVSSEKLAMLAFMEEVVTVVVHDSTNPQDERIVEVWNDGIPQRFIRGQEQQVKRKYVEVLARAKQEGYSQEELPNKEGYRNIPHTALRYPFAVVGDSDKGKAWLKRVLAEA